MCCTVATRPTSVIGAFPTWGRSLLGEFAAIVGSSSRPFPCTFAVSALRRGNLRYAFIASSTEETAWWPLPEILTRYVSVAPGIGRRTSLVVFFRPDHEPLPIGDYELTLWRLLQFLHDRDPKPWPAHIPLQTDSEYWEFCFAGEAIFVVCSTPAHRRRASRRSSSFVVTFQPRWVFDGLGAELREGSRARGKIRRRMAGYDVVSPHPELGPYGDPRYREWRQYFLPDENQPQKWTCPLKVGRCAQPAERPRGELPGASSPHRAARPVCVPAA